MENVFSGFELTGISDVKILFFYLEDGVGGMRANAHRMGCERVTSEIKGHGCVNGSRVPFQIFGLWPFILKGI